MTNLGVVDLYNYFGTDLIAADSGDLLTVSDSLMTQQRIIRRLLTNMQDYIWHVSYGAGCGNFVGEGLSLAMEIKIKSLIQSQIFLESTVAKNPAPVITLTEISGGISCEIKYYDAPTQQPVVLTFNVNI